jgi:hypothetical protein
LQDVADVVALTDAPCFGRPWLPGKLLQVPGGMH